jgi:hypothetical protein
MGLYFSVFSVNSVVHWLLLDNCHYVEDFKIAKTPFPVKICLLSQMNVLLMFSNP